MRKRFDIFWFGDNGPTWIEAVETLETAKARIEKLPQGNSGSYSVVDQRTGNRLSFAEKLQASGARTRQELAGIGLALTHNGGPNRPLAPE